MRNRLDLVQQLHTASVPGWHVFRPLACVLLCLTSCSDPAADSSPENFSMPSPVMQTEPREEHFHSENKTRVPRYKIFKTEHKSVAPEGVQHRRFLVVVDEYDSKDELLACAKELYVEAKANIEDRQPDAQFKRITILFYDSEEGAGDSDSLVMLVKTRGGAVSQLPEWPEVDIEWHRAVLEKKPSNLRQ